MSQEEWSIPSQAAQNFRGFWGCSDGPVTQVLKLPVKETCRAKPCGRDNMYTHTHRDTSKGDCGFFSYFTTHKNDSSSNGLQPILTLLLSNLRPVRHIASPISVAQLEMASSPRAIAGAKCMVVVPLIPPPPMVVVVVVVRSMRSTITPSFKKFAPSLGTTAILV